MIAHGVEVAEVPARRALPIRRTLRVWLTDELQILLEQRQVRIGVVGTMLVLASATELLPGRSLDSSWIFVVAVAISAIAGGVAEGLVVALVASVAASLYIGASAGGMDGASLAVMTGGRFVFFGLTAAFLGAFAEAHHSVQTRFKELAATDPLTKVANVATFYEQIERLEALAEDFAILVVDIDDLKILNDRHGHQVGSAAIRCVANVLRGVVRTSDLVARYGGDEFVVILRQVDRPGAQIVSNRIREMLGQEMLPGVATDKVTVSIGTALFGEDGTTSEELLAVADQAMYRDKRTHKPVLPPV